ncbi:hypothetical protein BH20CHL5_BH20CHL5_03370 [soil metagenome]
MQRNDSHPSTAAILGHPVHPMIVPIPIGALSLALVTDLVAQRSSDRFWPRASRSLLAVGAVGAIAAAPSGTVDFLTIPRARQLPEAWLHAGGNLAVVGLTVANLALRRGEDRRVSRAGLAMSALGAGMLAVTGWLGGELSFRHRIGVAAQEGETRGSDDPSRGQIDAFRGHSAMAVPMVAEAGPTVAGEGLSPAEAEGVARDLAVADPPPDVPDPTIEGRSGGG